MTQPQITVIIPVYNTSEYLIQCLNTVINQTFQAIEIICVNDGSTDNSLEILKEFSSKDNRIVIINRESSSGSAALPRNMGLNIASGKYVMFLDSDDYFDITMLEKLFIHAEQIGADLVMCDNYTILFNTGEISDKNTELHQKYLPDMEVFSYKDIPETIFQISNAAVWHKLILRETLIRYNLRFQLNIPILDDIFFVNLLLVLSERISIIPDRLIFYRLNRHGAQTTIIEKHKESICLAFLELNKYLMEHLLYEKIKLSLQHWTLTALEWWLRSIDNYSVFSELHDLYKSEYFDALGLMDIDHCTLSLKAKRFYDRVLGYGEPLLNDVLESVLAPGSRMVIYGAGMVGRYVVQFVKTHGKHEIVFLCDKNAAKLDNPLVKPPDELRTADFDAIIIAIENYTVVDEVRAYLKGIGIDLQKVYSV